MNTISIWNDKIILHWDGVLPPKTPPNAIHEPADVIHFWEHLDGFIRTSRRGGFMMDFSKQNIKRLHAQFGEIPIENGKEKIAELKQEQSSLYDMVQKAIKVKELPVERLPLHSYKVPPLAEYQHRGVILMCNLPRVPLFADCGLGKTYMVLVSTERQIQMGVLEPGKTLICAKLATLETGWIEDAEKFTNLKIMNLWVKQQKNRKEKILERLNTPADVYLINHEGARLFKDELAAKRFDKVVVDESTILKGFHGMDPAIKGGQFGRALMELSEHAKWRVIMSGTPAPNGPHDLYGQFLFLDPKGLILEGSFRDFQNAFMECLDLRPSSQKWRTIDGEKIFIPPRYNSPRKWIPKKDGVAKVSELIAPLAYRLRIRDHLKDLPELTVIKRVVDMGEEQARHYFDMEKKLKVEINDSRITVPVKVAQIMKLRQITGGFIIDHQEQTHAIEDSPKLAELDSLLEDEIEASHKVVIYVQYQWEVKTLENRYKNKGIVSVYGGNSAQKNLSNIKAFREDPKVRLIVLHPKSAAHGVTFTVSHYMIFYSYDHSAEDNYQCIARIKRAGQKNAMFVYYLMCRDSIDEDIYKAIQIKNRNQEQLIDQDQLLVNLWSKR